MPDMHTAPTTELPSSRTLLRSTAIALVVALVLLVTAVLPAEYGVDPTGIGRVLGLTQMGEIKMELAREAAATEAAEAAASAVAAGAPAAPGAPAATPAGSPAAPESASATAMVAAPDSGKSDVTEVVLRPNQSGEIKLVMGKGARVRYSWTTDRGAVNFETHGDTVGAPPGVFHSYSKGRDARSHEGELVAVFDGNHGWFWRNRSGEVVTIMLRTDGAYRELKRLD